MVSKAILRVVSEPADLSNADVPRTFTVWEWTHVCCTDEESWKSENVDIETVATFHSISTTHTTSMIRNG